MSLLERAKLVDIDSSHLELVLNWRNQDHIRKVMFHDHIISKEAHLDWFRRIRKNNNAIFKIFYLDDEPIGVVHFSSIDFQSSRCYWGFYIGEQNAPKGSGTLMGYLALNFIFEELKIRKLCAEIIDLNVKSICFHQKFSFQEEGILRKHILKDNKYMDVRLVALFNEHWKKQKNEFKILFED